MTSPAKPCSVCLLGIYSVTHQDVETAKKNGDDSDDHYVCDNCYLEKQSLKSSLGAYLRLSEAPYLIFEWHTGYNGMNIPRTR
jgi:hypothetical protein